MPHLWFRSVLLIAVSMLAACGDDGSGAAPDAGDQPDAAVAPAAWMATFGGQGRDRVVDLAIGPRGGVLVVGTHEAEAMVGDTSVGAEGQGGSFVARYAPDGALIWVRPFPVGARPTGIAVDTDGNFYVSGDFSGVVDFGDGPTESSSIDGFLIAHAPDGDRRWARTFGGPGFDGAFDVAVAAGMVAITGEFQAVVDFGATELTSKGLLRDGFVATYSTSGDPGWAQGFGGDEDGDEGIALAMNDDGSIAVTGLCNGNVNFGEYAETTDVSPEDFDLFVVVYPAGGGMPQSWHRHGAGRFAPKAIAFAPDGGTAIAGAFGGTAVFGDDSLESAGINDGFVALFDASGATRWSKAVGGEGFDDIADLAFTGLDVLVTGFVSMEVDLGDGPKGGETGALDFFWARYVLADGAHVASTRVRAAYVLDDTAGTAMAVGPAGQVVTAGTFSGTVTIDGNEITSAGADDGFVHQVLP